METAVIERAVVLIFAHYRATHIERDEGEFYNEYDCTNDLPASFIRKGPGTWLIRMAGGYAPTEAPEIERAPMPDWAKGGDGMPKRLVREGDGKPYSKDVQTGKKVRAVADTPATKPATATTPPEPKTVLRETGKAAGKVKEARGGDSIMRFVSGAKGKFRAGDVCKATGKGASAVWGALSRMIESGKLSKKSTGEGVFYEAV